jgi:glycosyltransferase involved in cell wall biosynthesis
VDEHRPARGGALRDPRLVFVGELAPQDGVSALPALLQALRERPDTPQATLVVVGDGSLRQELEEEFAARGLQDYVTMTGRVPHQEVPKLLAEADICIDVAPCSELNHRSTMIKIAEYLAAGRPVVTYDLLETRHTAGDAAVYAACGDGRQFAEAVAELARDPRRRQSLARGGRARVPDLAWERSEERLLAAYAALGRSMRPAADS